MNDTWGESVSDPEEENKDKVGGWWKVGRKDEKKREESVDQ